MAIADPVLHPHRFSRSEYYAIADELDPSLRYELLDGAIYAMSPAKPPHSGCVDFFLNRLAPLVGRYQLRSQSVVEIEPDGSPEPDVAVLSFRADYYTPSHPNGGDAHLVIEVGDTERNPREKMSKYMRDGASRTAGVSTFRTAAWNFGSPRTSSNPLRFCAARTGSALRASRLPSTARSPFRKARSDADRNHGRQRCSRSADCPRHGKALPSRGRIAGQSLALFVANLVKEAVL